MSGWRPGKDFRQREEDPLRSLTVLRHTTLFLSKHHSLLTTWLPTEAISNYTQWPLTFLTCRKLFQKGSSLSLHLNLTKINGVNDFPAICSKATGTFPCSLLLWNDPPMSSFCISHAVTTDNFLSMDKLGLTADLLTDHWHQENLQLFWLDDFWIST